MKIVYMSALDMNEKNGAVDHVLGLSSALDKLGHEVHLVTGSRRGDPERSPSDSTLILGYYGFLSSVRAARAAAKRALVVIANVRPDIVYLRAFPMDYLLFSRHLVRNGVPYVVELNSVTDAEYTAAGKALRGGLYRFFEGRTLDNAVGWFPVTSEIYEYALHASGTKRPFLIAKNGFDTEGIVPLRSPASIRKELGVADSTPVLVMCGFRWPWHGADRAISMLACMKKRAELWLIGSPDNKHKRLVEQAAESQGVASQVRVFPWMSEEGAADLVAAADVGLGALALDRKRMTEAQPLKVAMYLALGIPVLFNHADPRLSMELPFAMSVRSTDPKVLAEHSEYLLDQSQNGSETIRKFAVERLSWRAVAEEAADFLQDLTLQK